MTRLTRILLSAAMGTALALPAYAQDDDGWDVNNPPGDKREITIDVDEGTWMSLDVSPDGQTIAFDFLGDIYVMPFEGGRARAIASGMAWEIQPRFSPDGSRIAFTSDRGGGDNIWVMDADGSDAYAVTDESFRLMNNPTWSPDGRFIAARKHFTTQRSLGTGEIWLYHVSGGSGVALVEKPSESHQKELGEPIFSADGRYIYYSANTTPGPIFEYAQDSNGQLFEILRYDMQTGETESFAGGAGGAVRPAPSPDGRYMAYVKRIRTESALFLKDMRSGEEFPVYYDLDKDMQETWAVHGVYPNMDWTPDSSEIVFWAGGKIRALNVNTMQTREIPFRITDTRTVIDAPRPKVDVSPDTVTSKMPRFAVKSPDGSQVVFEAFGQLYVKPVSGGTARRLTQGDSDGFEFFPAWSRAGNSVVYVHWNDDSLGSIRMVDVASGASRTLTTEPGHYRRPGISPDGRYVVFEKGEGGYLTDPTWSAAPGIYVMETSGGAMRKVTDGGSSPHFGPASDRVYFTASRGGDRALVSTDMNGQDEQVLASSKLAQMFLMSPAGDNIAFREDYNLHVMPFTGTPKNVSTGTRGGALPVTRVSGYGALYPAFSADGREIYWSVGPTLQSARLADVFATGGDKVEFEPPEGGLDLAVSVPADRPDSVIAFTGARIITMSDDDGGVIENGTLVVRGNKILAVGADVSIPSGAEIIDVTGKTIIPGLIDAHAHGPYGRDDLIPQQNWNTMAHLALGVTTIHDPSSVASLVFASSEYQRAGKILAPRIFSTGEIIYGAKSPRVYAVINNLEDAEGHVRRLKAQGAMSVKNYNQPRREQRQQVVTAARAENIAVVAEGGSLFHMDLSMVADGNTSIEHNLPQAVLYEDVLQFYSQTNVAYVPTLAVTYGGVRGEDYWYQESDVWLHPLLSQHVPPQFLQARAVRRQMAPESDYLDDDSAAGAKALAERGVLVAIGAHGQREGLAAHWEMWSFVRGGMSPLQALKTATIWPAEHLGYDDDIGSLEPGKLADLVILDANPLDDIRNSDDIDKVMIGGRLYDADTLAEEVSGSSTPRPYFWE